jgi:hypothetical protein
VEPGRSITATEALAASTDRQTTLQPGSRGDVVLLDADPLRVVGDRADVRVADTAAVAAHLRSIRVAATVVAGRPTHVALEEPR